MHVFLLFTGGGALAILTSHASIEDPDLLAKLAGKGIDRFLAFEAPLALARARYGMHFDIVARSVAETDDLRVLDFDGARAARLFRFDEMSGLTLHEAASAPAVVAA
jgi:hypothetical protein